MATPEFVALLVPYHTQKSIDVDLEPSKPTARGALVSITWPLSNYNRYFSAVVPIRSSTEVAQRHNL